MKILKYIPILCIVAFTSCDLNLLPISEIEETVYYNNTAEINSAVVACYNGLQQPMEFEWMLTELRTDNSRLYNTATTSSDNTLLFDFDQAKVSSTNARVYDYWTASYRNIARCNTVINPVHLAVVADESLKNQYEGEAKFMRAYHYFNLVRLFGPVFIVTENISAQQARTYDRSPVEDVYELIQSDLNSAIEKLPVSYSDAEKGRITSWAAKALLAKVYMTQGRVDIETRDLLKDIYDNSGYRLMDTYASVFDINNEVNDEILFTVRYKSGGLGLGSMFGNSFAPQLSGLSVINGDGSGFNYPSSDLIGVYTSADTRKDVTLALSYTNTQNTIVDRRYVKKYLSPVTVKNDGDKDWPIIRFADVILMYAELENELNGVEAALPLINETRHRAGLFDLNDVSVPNKHTMRMEIEKERRLEFAYENHRWFDLVRTGRAIDVINAHYVKEDYYLTLTGVGPLNSSTLLMPIPQKEIDINQNISQNVGY